MQSSGNPELLTRALYIAQNMVGMKKEFAEALAAPFEFKGEEGETPIKLDGLELLSVLLHTTPDANVKASCTEVLCPRLLALTPRSFKAW